MYDIQKYTEATCLDELFDALDAGAMIIAGGTDVLIKAREFKPGYENLNLVGISRIPGIKDICMTESGIEIGACSSFSQIEINNIIKRNLNSISVAAGTVGGPQVRNMGTIGGNICNGATSADTASSLFALNAVLKLLSKDSERLVPIKDFYLGAGKTDVRKGEVLKSIIIKKEDYEGYKGQYIKLSQRNAMDIATLGCSVWLKRDGNLISDLRIAYGVAAPTPVRADEAEKYAQNKECSEENVRQIAEKCLDNTNARDSWRASKAYRDSLIVELCIRAINDAWALLI